MIYFDNAATTGRKPLSVINAVQKALKYNCANPGRGGYETARNTDELIFSCRKKVCGLFHCESEENVIFTKNCTEAVNIVLKGILNAGDHVITTSIEHNAVARPLKALTKNGVYVDYAEVVFDDVDSIVKTISLLIKSNTKLVVCTHASNVTGHMLPVGKIGKLCHDRGILFAVDAAQTAGIVPIDVQADNIDYLCVAAHKGLYAPMGTGILIANEEIPKTIFEGGTGSNSSSVMQPSDMPDKFESGTLNVPGIAGLLAGINYVLSKGIKNIYEHEIQLAAYFYEKLKGIKNVSVYSMHPTIGKTVPTIAFNFRNRSSGEIGDILAKQNIAVRTGLHCAPLLHSRIGTIDKGAVRVSFSMFNNKKEIDEVINFIKQIK